MVPGLAEAVDQEKDDIDNDREFIIKFSLVYLCKEDGICKKKFFIHLKINKNHPCQMWSPSH